MELKVWCDGIQRIVCGASASTTCQDVVFALAHATGQTGRFILIEKWRNNERVLAPMDQPIISLAKWGEFANDVTFIMKKSGNADNLDTSSSNKKDNNLHDGDLNNDVARLKSNSSSRTIGKQSIKHSTSETESVSMKHRKTNQTQDIKHSIEPSSESSSISPDRFNQHNLSSHQPSKNGFDRTVLSLKQKSFNQTIDKIENEHCRQQEVASEPLYSTVNKNRPSKPPPYSEAIAKSTLVNLINQDSFDLLRNQTIENRISSLLLNSSHLNSTSSQKPNQQNHSIPNSDLNFLSDRQKKTINLISIQQKTLMKQEKSMANIEKEIDSVQRRLSENEFVVNQYRDEINLLREKWLEQEAIIEKLETENLDEQLEKLIDDGKHYENEIKAIKQNLSDCEDKIIKRRHEITNLMKTIENFNQINPLDEEIENDSNQIDRLKFSIQEKNNKIQAQRLDLNVLNDSLEHLDQTIQAKNNIVDQLMFQIKEANFDGLALQSLSKVPSSTVINSLGLTTDNRNDSESNQSQQQHQSSNSFTNKSVTNRRIPVSLHELGNTVPTKRNPDGIWV